MEWTWKAKRDSASPILLKLSTILVALCLLPTVTAVAQQGSTVVIPKQSIAQVPSPLSLRGLAGIDLPLGDSSQWFGYGGGVGLGMRYGLPHSIFSLLGGIEYSYASTQATSTSVSFAVARVGGGVRIPLTSGIAVQGFAYGGYYLATYNDFSNGAAEPYVAGGLGMRFSLDPSLGLEVGAQYKNCLGLYQGISAGAGMDVALGNLGGSVEMPTLELRPAFPVFFKHYDDHPIGTLKSRATSKCRPLTSRRRCSSRSTWTLPRW